MMNDSTDDNYHVAESSMLRRNATFGCYKKELIHSLIDAAPYCHVSAYVKGSPYIQVTVHWRDGERLYIHGAKKNKMINAITKGSKAALAFTHFDGYVLTRAAFNHVVSYRSVTLFGAAAEITDSVDKLKVLELFIERVSPGRWNTVRHPTDEELKQTGLLEFTIKEVSAKIMMQGDQLREVFPGGKYESPADSDFHPWTGLLPYTLVKKHPISAEEFLGNHREGAQ